METLNMLFGGDIYQLTYDEIKKILKNLSRVTGKRGRSSQGPISSSLSTLTIKQEIVSMIE